MKSFLEENSSQDDEFARAMTSLDSLKVDKVQKAGQEGHGSALHV